METLTPVAEATQLILNQQLNLPVESISLDAALGRVLAEELRADRDFPPFDRVTMDGIAIAFTAYESGQRTFCIQSMQPAGDVPHTLKKPDECIEVMTGAVLPVGTDTVVRYEDLAIKDSNATITTDCSLRQNIHFQGSDCQTGEIIVPENTRLRSPELAVAASIGKSEVSVYTLPRIAVITSGDELVDVATTPLPHQIRHSNSYSIRFLLAPYQPDIQHFHLPDDLQDTEQKLNGLLSEFDMLILSGGVSKGKKDYIPQALENLGVEKLFHRLAQRPGKPFWFGRTATTIIFALPGNPVSSFLCTVRYVLPFLRQTVKLPPRQPQYARLTKTVNFRSELTYFLTVKLSNDAEGVTWATPVAGNGSGDFASLTTADAFLELPAEKSVFTAGEAYPVWAF